MGGEIGMQTTVDNHMHSCTALVSLPTLAQVYDPPTRREKKCPSSRLIWGLHRLQVPSRPLLHAINKGTDLSQLYIIIYNYIIIYSIQSKYQDSYKMLQGSAMTQSDAEWMRLYGHWIQCNGGLHSSYTCSSMWKRGLDTLAMCFVDSNVQTV